MVSTKDITDADRSAIAAAIATAERTTTGEIVPVLAATSDDYERAEDLIGLAFGGTALAATWLLGQRLVPGADWDLEHDLALSLPVLLLVLVAGCWLGVQLARRVPFFKRLCLSPRTARARVLIAAHHAFDKLRVRNTANATGVVLYVSLFERQVCVCADRAIAGKVGEAEWARACELLTAALRAGKPAQGFTTAIEHVGKVLAAHFPSKPGDTNELTNELRILD